MKRTGETKQQLELFPGNLLAKRQVWQRFKGRLPAHTYLLITSLANPSQSGRMFELGRSLQKKGVSVFVLSLG